MRRRRFALIGALLVAAPVLAAGGGAGRAAQINPVHLPDLRTRAPENLTVQVENGTTVLRFSNTVYNFGAGPLELRPQNKRNGETDAYQRLYTHDANGNLVFVNELLVGTFIFHRSHHHWHFEGFAKYEIHQDNNGAVGALVLSSLKTTVCIRDNLNPESGSEGLDYFDGRHYTRCTKTSIEGLSVGYGDTYLWNIDGQDIDISGLPAGCYWLVSTANPDQAIQESNDNNNTGAIQFSYSGSSIGGC